MTVVITANVQSSLSRAGSTRCLEAALARRPDVLGLQEWHLGRTNLLSRSGGVHVAGSPLRMRTSLPGAMTWFVPMFGDCVVGLRSDRYTVRRHRSCRLGGVGLADLHSRRPPILPARWATVVEAWDRSVRRGVGIVVFHLVPGAQSRGEYSQVRPRTAARHRRETRALEAIVEQLSRRNDDVWAMGDSNFHGFSLPGLTSAWSGTGGRDGTLGSHRRVDDVLSNRVALRRLLYSTESDHRSLAVEYTDQGECLPDGTDS